MNGLKLMCVLLTWAVAAEVASFRKRMMRMAVRSARAAGGVPLIMADIPEKTEISTETSKNGVPPGLSDLRLTYNIPRAQITESIIGVVQPIDSHWCTDFKIPSVPYGCTCWRYEYLAYFCVDWSCVNGHASSFAQCQFLNVSWPIDPPQRRKPNDRVVIPKRH